MKNFAFLFFALSSVHFSIHLSTASPLGLSPSGLAPQSENFRMDWQSDPPADIGFCSRWNPDYGWFGQNCCPDAAKPKRRKNNKCAPKRQIWSKCQDRTADQIHYQKKVESQKLGDVLELIQEDILTEGPQSYCDPANGFLVHGRPIVETPQNAIVVKHQDRCHYFGTNAAIGMLEWLGREVRRGYYQAEYSGARLNVGDISSPRGGCISGGRARRAHFSHTNGRDIDLGFLNILNNRISPDKFDQRFDTAINSWLLKKILKNPIVCIKAILLDKKLIAKVNRYWAGNAEWAEMSRFVQHTRGHKNHFHIRVGFRPGKPGCGPDAHPEDEYEEVNDEGVDEP